VNDFRLVICAAIQVILYFVAIKAVGLKNNGAIYVGPINGDLASPGSTLPSPEDKYSFIVLSSVSVSSEYSMHDRTQFVKAI
jgi:hypothetical protein